MNKDELVIALSDLLMAGGFSYIIYQFCNSLTAATTELEAIKVGFGLVAFMLMGIAYLLMGKK